MQGRSAVSNVAASSADNAGSQARIDVLDGQCDQTVEALETRCTGQDGQ